MLPHRMTVILAAAGAHLTLGEQHPATVALSRASEIITLTIHRYDLAYVERRDGRPRELDQTYEIQSQT